MHTYFQILTHACKGKRLNARLLDGIESHTQRPESTRGGSRVQHLGARDVASPCVQHLARAAADHQHARLVVCGVLAADARAFGAPCPQGHCHDSVRLHIRM